LDVVIRNRIVASLASLSRAPLARPLMLRTAAAGIDIFGQIFSQRMMHRMSRPGRLPRPAGECATMGAASSEEAGMTKFMLLQNYGATLACDLPMTEWDPADIKAHIEFQMALNDELAGNGELVDAQGLAGPELARFVTFDGGTAPVVTDGPFPESKELLAGYRMIDVESEARAIEVAAKASAAPGPGGVPIQQPIEVRQVMGAPANGE
jgi:hypothetical protein